MTSNMDTFVTIPLHRWQDLTAAAEKVESAQDRVREVELALERSQRDFTQLSQQHAMLQAIEKTPETRKYRLEPEGDLFRVYALRDIPHVVKAGARGGLIWGERALRQEGNCWIGEQVTVTGSAVVTDNAYVTGETTLSDRCKIQRNATVDDCQVSGYALISEKASACGSTIGGHTVLQGHSQVNDSTLLHGQFENVELDGVKFVGVEGEFTRMLAGRLPAGTIVRSRTDLFQMMSHWGMVTLARHEQGHVITIGCTDFQLDELEDALADTDSNDDYNQVQLEGFTLIATKLIESWAPKETATSVRIPDAPGSIVTTEVSF